MVRLEVFYQRFLVVFGEADAQVADEEFAETLQTFVIFGSTVRVELDDLRKRHRAEAALERLGVAVDVEVEHVVVGRQLNLLFDLERTELTFEGILDA